MCKIMIMSGIKHNTRKLALQFIEEMAFQMSSGSDRDGLGYAALNEAGDLFGERWLNNDDAFVRRSIKSDKCKEIEQELAGLLSENQVGETYGEFGIGVGGLDSISAITLHTRLATSGKGFANCHPFVSEDGLTSLIHNGVITNQSALKNVMSTNDSECILHEYTDNKVNCHPKNIQKVADRLSGWYACGVFSETKDGQKILDIFKEDSARLFAAYITELETMVFSTSLQYLENACADLELTIEASYKVKEGVLFRFNPFTGQKILSESFNLTRQYWANDDYWGNVNQKSDEYWERKGYTNESKMTESDQVEAVKEQLNNVKSIKASKIPHGKQSVMVANGWKFKDGYWYKEKKKKGSGSQYGY